jgi:neutral ceramidase
MMGYANSSQVGSGLRQRLYSRAFIVGDPSKTSERFVYLVLDTQSGDSAIRNGILEGLQEMGSEYAVYGKNNVAVTGTHSHAGPGAWLNYLLPQITSQGFDKQSYRAIVDGTLLSIKRAHESLTLGTVSAGTAKIADANINRSVFAYLANPQAERDRYTDNVDKTMTLLKFTRASDGKSIGILNWFPVHGTSLLGNQTLIAGDNKGVAAYLLEKDMEANADESNAAEGFVAGFSQANVGDTTPNVLGAYCEDGSGQQCRLNDSTCGGKSQDCHGRGPYFGLNDGGHKSCYEIGKRQAQGARSIYDSNAFTPISGKVRSFHTFVDFSNFTFTLKNGSVVRTCPAAMGNSFAAGTSDGPGAFDFVQNDPGAPSNPFWNLVGSAIAPPSKEQKACQYPKPVLLNVGQANTPYPWSPNIVDIQVLRVGQLVIIVSPGEATTMSGRRWREAVHNAIVSSSIASSPIVVLGGPANSYTHYIATEEEYGIQRYEGASTLYGQHTLNAYINSTLTYLRYLADDVTSSPPLGPSPPDNRDKSISLITGVVYDGAGFGRSFGQVTKDVLPTYARGATVSATFVGANPRNNLRLEGTFAAIEKQQQSSNGAASWVQVRNDEDWELVYQWKRVNGLTGTSDVTITWDTGLTGPEAGTYRIRYYGDAKKVGGAITAFEGVSGVFRLT